jgi:hypothetical protein
MTDRIAHHRLTLASGVAILSLVAACNGTTASPSTSTAASLAPVATSAAPAASPSSDAASQAPASAPAASAPAPSNGPGASGAAPSLGTTGRIVNQAKGYAVTLPAGWTRLGLSASDLDQLIATAGSAMTPEAKAALKQQLLASGGSGLEFFAIDLTSVTASGASTMTILSSPSGGLSIDLLEQVTVAQVKQLPTVSGEVKSERITLPSGDAIHLTYSIASPLASGATGAHLEQYMIVGGGQIYVLSVTSTDAKKAAAAGEAAANSFEVLAGG